MEVFTRIFDENSWGSTESRSGPGSTLARTLNAKIALETVFSLTKVSSLLDLPCGDGNWIHTVNLENIDYHGADVVAEAVQLAQERMQAHSNAKSMQFSVLDAVTSDLPKNVGLVLCRDALVHLPLAAAKRAIQNFRSSGALWLLATTFSEQEVNEDMNKAGGWRRLNLCAAPFSLPAPIASFYEFDDTNVPNGTKMLGLWFLPTLVL